MLAPPVKLAAVETVAPAVEHGAPLPKNASTSKKIPAIAVAVAANATGGDSDAKAENAVASSMFAIKYHSYRHRFARCCNVLQSFRAFVQVLCTQPSILCH